MHVKILVIFLLYFCGGVCSVFSQGDAPLVVQEQVQPAVVNEAEMVLIEEIPNAQPAVSTNAFTSVGATFRAFFVLALVLAMAYLFLRFLRKLSGQESSESHVIKVMASQTLKGQCGLHIVEIAGKVYILGAGESVSLISEITNKEALDELRLSVNQKPLKQSFAQLLRGKLALQGVDPKIKTMLNTDEQADRLRQLLPKKTDINQKEKSLHE